MVMVPDKRPLGERPKGIRQADDPAQQSSIPPLPCFPSLKRELRSWTATLLLTYLEIHHPSRQDAHGTLQNDEIQLEQDVVCEHLQVSRRTLFVTLCVLCARFKTELQRSRAARSAREFLNPAHITYGSIKHYSMVGPSSTRPGTVVYLRRNHRLIAQTLANAELTSQIIIDAATAFSSVHASFPSFLPQLAAATTTPQAHPQPTPNIPLATIERASNSLSSLQSGASNSRLIDALLAGSVLSGDRRSVRYPRLRKAVEAGLEGAEVLSVKRSARKRGNIPDGTEICTPCTPEADDTKEVDDFSK